jgi:hypothetical protein
MNSYCLGKTVFAEMIAYMIGKKGSYLKGLTERHGAHYIWYNNEPDPMFGDDRNKNGVFEIWASGSIIQQVVTSLQSHLTTKMREFQYHYYSRQMKRIFGKYDSARVSEIPKLLRLNHDYELDLMDELMCNYSPDACLTHLTVSCEDCRVPKATTTKCSRCNRGLYWDNTSSVDYWCHSCFGLSEIISTTYSEKSQQDTSYSRLYSSRDDLRASSSRLFDHYPDEE